MTAELDLIDLFLDVLKAGQKKPSKWSVLHTYDISCLMADNSGVNDDKVRESVFGYPSTPLYKDIGRRLHDWMMTGCCPLDQLPKYDHVGEDAVERQRKINLITSKLEKLKSLHGHVSQDESIYYMKEIIQILGRKGLLELLGANESGVTWNLWPPPKKYLIQTFCDIDDPESASSLTVGACALIKHCQNNPSSRWWGECIGSDDAKNAYALKKMMEIMDGTTCIYMHDEENEIIEVRQEDGYGLRWIGCGEVFDEFLEPTLMDENEDPAKYYQL